MQNKPSLQKAKIQNTLPTAFLIWKGAQKGIFSDFALGPINENTPVTNPNMAHVLTVQATNMVLLNLAKASGSRNAFRVSTSSTRRGKMYVVIQGVPCGLSDLTVGSVNKRMAKQEKVRKDLKTTEMQWFLPDNESQGARFK